MGGSKKYIPSGGFTEQLYECVQLTANGIKIIEPKDKSQKAKTPTFSNTPNTMYAKTSDGIVNQIAVYGKGVDRRSKLKDIDIGHKHNNPDNELSFGEKDIHVHDYDDNGVRLKNARKPSKKEKRLIMIARYGK